MNAQSAKFRAMAGTVAVALLLALAVDPAAAVNRCEDRDGRVTYTDEPCPATARNARRVDDSPPVQVREAPARPAAEPGAARLDAGAKDAKDDKDNKNGKDERDGTADKAGAARLAARDAQEAGKAALQPSRVAASANPEQEMRRLDELRLRQQQQCAQITRRIDYARGDLQAAVGPDRASAELALRRLQEEARLVCPPR